MLTSSLSRRKGNLVRDLNGKEILKMFECDYIHPKDTILIWK